MATDLMPERMAELRERDRMLQEFARDFRLDGEQLVCVHCKRRCVGAREDEDFVHAPDCAARMVGGRPWVRLCTMLLMPIDLPALLRAAEERDRLAGLEAARQSDYETLREWLGCKSSECGDLLCGAQDLVEERDRLRAQRDALVAVASFAVSGVVMIRDDCYRDVLVVDPDKIEALRAAIRAAKENQ